MRPIIDPWIERLRGESTERERAIRELRALLVRGLSKSLSQRYGGKLQIDDVAQVAIIRILNAMDSFQGRSRFTTWALAIGIRIGISELRRMHYRDVSLDLNDGGISIGHRDLSVSSCLADNDRRREEVLGLLEKLINEALTRRQSDAIRGTLLGLPIEEIAHRLGSNRNAVYKLVHDARMRLKQGFEQYGFDADEIQSLFP